MTGPWTDYAPTQEAGPWADYAAPSVGVGEDLAKTALPSMARMAAGTLGLPGDIAGLMNRGIDYVGQKLGAKPTAPTDYELGGSGQITRGIEKATGPLYQPQTPGGKLFDTAAQFAPAVLGGPETLAAKVGTRVLAPAAGLEAAKAATDNPYAQVGAAIASSALAHKAVTPGAAKTVLPTAEQTVAAGEAGYKAPEIAAVQFKPQAIDQLSNSIQADLKRAKLNDKLAPKTLGMVEDLKNPVNNVQDIENLETTRRLLGKVAGNPLAAEEQAAATIAMKKIDKYMDNLPQSHLLAGDAAAANTALKTARADYAHGMSAGRVEQKIRNAELGAASTYSGGNINNKTRQALRPLLTSAKQGRGLTADDLAAVENAVRGSKVGDAMRVAGKAMGGTNAGLAGAYGAGALLTHGAIGLLPPLGYALKKAGDVLTVNKANKIVQQILARSPEAQKWAAIQGRITAANPQTSIGSVRGGLLSGAFAPPSRGLLDQTSIPANARPTEGLLPLDSAGNPSPDAFGAAAARTRNSVMPEGGRQQGILSNIAPAMAHGLATLPERAMHAAGDLQRTGDVYNPRPAIESALLTMGGTSFGAPRGAVGAGPVKSAAAPANPVVHAERLTQALRDANPETFRAEYETLKSMSSDEVKAIAAEFNGRSFSSKSDALKRTWQRFEQMEQVRMKKNFVAGRSAG